MSICFADKLINICKKHGNELLNPHFDCVRPFLSTGSICARSRDRVVEGQDPDAAVGVAAALR